MIVTAAGSLPGDDFRGALGAMREVLPELLPMPELPGRGVESGMIGRTLGLIEGLSFDLQPAGWRLTSHSDAAHRRAKAAWRRDLDDLEELLQGFDGTLKIALAGPWTLAATVERPAGDRLLADHGARREVRAALLEGIVSLRESLARRLPSVEIRWQTDEPCLPAVRDAQIPTASGFSKHRRVDLPELRDALRPFSRSILHCCMGGDWVQLAREAGFEQVYVDAHFADIDELGAHVDAGGQVVLGVVDTSLPARQPADRLVDAARRVTRELGVGDWLTLAPACGLAGWPQGDVVWQLGQLRRAAALLDADRD